jgi:hypothetical protein
MVGAHSLTYTSHFDSRASPFDILPGCEETEAKRRVPYAIRRRDKGGLCSPQSHYGKDQAVCCR